MRVLLIYPDSPTELIGWGDLGAIAEPLALEYLAAGAQLDGHQVRILDLRLHPKDLHGTLRDFSPEVVGCTGYSMHVLRNLAILKEVKRLLPGVLTVVGGHHATLLPEDFFEPQVDWVVTGEGTGPLRQLLRQAANPGVSEFPRVAGVWSRDTSGTFQVGAEETPLLADALPRPDRSLVPGDRSEYFIDWMQPIALMRSTVGCPYRCNFCSLWRIAGGRYDKREVSNVVDELGSIAEEFVFFVDDEAFVDGPRMETLAEAIEASGIRKRYFTYCRIDTLIRHGDLMAKWRSVGLERLFIGIEAVTDEQLKNYDKRLEVAQVEKGLRRAAELGIEVFAGFIVHPSFRERDFDRLVRFIEHNQIRYPSFTIWTPLPGTPALTTFDSVIARQPNGRPDWSKFDLQHAVVRTALSPQRFMEEYRKLQRVFSSSYTRYRSRAPVQASSDRSALVSY